MSYRTGRGNNNVNSGHRAGPRDAMEAEQMHDLIRVAISRGMSDGEAALYADCSTRTVFRYRKRHGIPRTDR